MWVVSLPSTHSNNYSQKIHLQLKTSMHPPCLAAGLVSYAWQIFITLAMAERKAFLLFIHNLTMLALNQLPHFVFLTA